MADADTVEKVKSKTKTKPKVARPTRFKVIYLNDDVTTMEFVLMTLVEIFGKSIEEANQIMLTVHEEGSAVVAVLPYEIAEQKGVEVTVLARQNNFPFNVRLEAE